MEVNSNSQEGVVVEKPSTALNVRQIMDILPHRYPFLMVDKVLEYTDNERIVAIKNVSANEPFFMGHFPEKPVMPGVMVLEAMAQTAAILAHISSDGVTKGKTVYFVGADKVKWKRMVLPGDTLQIELITVKKRKPVWAMEGRVTVEGKLVCQGKVSAMESE